MLSGFCSPSTNNSIITNCSVGSPASPLSQCSLTDKEVALLSSKEPRTALTSRPAPILPAPSATPLTHWEKIVKSDTNEVCALDEVDEFLESIVEDDSPALKVPSSPMVIQSHVSAFTRVTSLLNSNKSSEKSQSPNHNFMKNFATKLSYNSVGVAKERCLHSSPEDNSIADEIAELQGDCVNSTSGAKEIVMLDENQFLSPTGSVVSEDSGYNDEVTSGVAVSEAGSGLADTRTTCSSSVTSAKMPIYTPSAATTRLECKMHSPSNAMNTPITCSSSILIPPSVTSMSLIPCSIVSTMSSATYHSLSNSSVSSKSNSSLSNGHQNYLESIEDVNLSPESSVSYSEGEKNKNFPSDPIFKTSVIVNQYPRLSLTELFTIFEQNISLPEDNSSTQYPNVPCSLVSSNDDTTLHNSEPTPISDPVLNTSNKSFNPDSCSAINGESEQVAIPADLSDTISLLDSSNEPLNSSKLKGISGRPFKKKYNRRSHPDADKDEKAPCDTTDTKSTDISVHEHNTRVPETRNCNPLPQDITNKTLKRKKFDDRVNVDDCGRKPKCARNESTSGPIRRPRKINLPPARKSTRKLIPDQHLAVLTPSQTSNTAALLNVRPSLAALLPPISHTSKAK